MRERYKIVYNSGRLKSWALIDHHFDYLVGRYWTRRGVEKAKLACVKADTRQARADWNLQAWLSGDGA